MDTVIEKILLCHPNIVPYYRHRYEIYVKMNIPFDLFFNEDIINYKDQEFYSLRFLSSERLFTFKTPEIKIYNCDDLNNGILNGSNNTLYLSGITKLFDADNFYYPAIPCSIFMKQRLWQN